MWVFRIFGKWCGVSSASVLENERMDLKDGFVRCCLQVRRYERH